jgi:hypothetical protein
MYDTYRKIGCKLLLNISECLQNYMASQQVEQSYVMTDGFMALEVLHSTEL